MSPVDETRSLSVASGTCGQGMCESFGHVDDGEALPAATHGVYCDKCACLDGGDRDSEPCAEGREKSA